MHEAGVKIWRYQRGFMHQKVLLADDDLAIVGSVNLDFRSFMLNFELSAVVQDAGFAKSVGKMLEKDFARSEAENLQKYDKGKYFFRLKCRLCSLDEPRTIAKNVGSPAARVSRAGSLTSRAQLIKKYCQNHYGT